MKLKTTLADIKKSLRFDLKSSTESEITTFSGNSFHSFIVLGKYENL